MIPTWLVQVFLSFILGLVGTIIGFPIGAYIYTKYFAPRQASDIAVRTADAIVKHEKVKPWIEKGKELVEKVEKLDLQELVDMAKGLKVFVEVQNKKKPPPPPKSSNK